MAIEDKDLTVDSSDDEEASGKRVHVISVEKLVVHKFDDPDALMRKAHKVAKQIIHDELREGEFVQEIRPGRFHLHLPKLRPDAGALRCSVITEQLYRAVRALNPTAIQLNSDTPSALAPDPIKTTAKKPAAATPSTPAPTSERPEDAEKRKLASQAIAAMTRPDLGLYEEMLASPMGQALSREVGPALTPIWNVKSKMIIGHDCSPVRNGVPFLDSDPLLQEAGLDGSDAAAIVDSIVYGKACEVLRRSVVTRKTELIICPVHASTLAQGKYVGAFLSAGGSVPAEVAQKLLVFVVSGFVDPVSRIRVRDVSGYLRPRCRTMMARVALNTRDISPAFKEFGFSGLWTSVAGSHAAEERLLEEMEGFAARCEGAKMASALDGVKTRSLAVGALASGFSYISGGVIKHADAGGVQPFNLENLFA